MTSSRHTPNSNLRRPPIGDNANIDRWIMGLLILITVIRSLAIFASPLELGVDEAQYWAWSQTPDFGYFTKPPLIAWVIGVSHALFGHEVWAVRLPAPWLHVLTAVVLWRAASWIAGPAAGRWAAILWIALPIISVGSFVISTDTPLLLALSTALMLMIGVLQNRLDPVRGMFICGLAVGIGFLAKYAALYFLAGIVLWATWDRFITAHNVITVRHLLLFGLGMMIAASPNIIWNLTNDFTTVRHLGDNANIAKQSFDFAKTGRFLLGQLGVVGPVTFILMLGILRPPFHSSLKRLMICLSLPILALMTIQAFISDANANWTVASYPALIVWLACWIAQTNRWRWGLLASGINGAIAIVIISTSMSGSLGIFTPASDPLRRLRGWEALATDLKAALDRHEAHLIVADRRATAALMGWHFYNTDVTITLYDSDGIPGNHYERNHAFGSIKTASRNLIAVDGQSHAPALPQVVWRANDAISEHVISANRTRKLFLYAGTQTPK
jgi:4-amino-4-deoxy-L-arabinose transferase-like glycosyltransferase